MAHLEYCDVTEGLKEEGNELQAVLRRCRARGCQGPSKGSNEEANRKCLLRASLDVSSSSLRQNRQSFQLRYESNRIGQCAVTETCAITKLLTSSAVQALQNISCNRSN